MLSEDIYLNFHDFQPTRFMRLYLGSFISEVHEQSPCGARINASFSRKGDKIKGRIKVISAVGHFFALAEGKRLKEVTAKLNSQMKRQLIRWKKNRFKSEDKKVLV